jgi:hypothetical protein
MSNPVFIQHDIHNNLLFSTKAMPLKNTTADNSSDFELGRKVYNDAYIPPLTNASAASLLQSPHFGMSGINRIRPTIFDGTHTPMQKKWMGSTNRDSSQVSANRRNNSIGKGSLNLSKAPFSFNNGNDKNLINSTLNRVRGGGAVAPPKKNFSPNHTYVPSPGTHPYMQPGFKGKIAGYFPTSRYNKEMYQNNS